MVILKIFSIAVFSLFMIFFSITGAKSGLTTKSSFNSLNIRVDFYLDKSDEMP